MLIWLFLISKLYLHGTFLDSLMNIQSINVKFVNYDKIMANCDHDRKPSKNDKELLYCNFEMFCKAIFGNIKACIIDKIVANYEIAKNKFFIIDSKQIIKVMECTNKRKTSVINFITSKYDIVQYDLEKLFKKIYFIYNERLIKIIEKFKDDKLQLVDKLKKNSKVFSLFKFKKEKIVSVGNSDNTYKILFINKMHSNTTYNVINDKINLKKQIRIKKRHIRKYLFKKIAHEEIKVEKTKRMTELQINEALHFNYIEVIKQIKTIDDLNKIEFFSLYHKEMYESVRLTHSLIYIILQSLMKYMFNGLENYSALLLQLLKKDIFKNFSQEKKILCS